MKLISGLLLVAAVATSPLRADILFQDSSNYPYANGCIIGQGQWYCYNPSTNRCDAIVTNNTLLLNTTNFDDVATPTNGWNNPTEYNFLSFSLNVSQIPSSPGGSYFCEFFSQGASNNICHLFIDTTNTVVPGTYRLGIANFSTSFGSAYAPINYPMDLAPGVNYTVVVLFDSNPGNAELAGSSLYVNPSVQDFENEEDGIITGPNMGPGYVYANDVPITYENLNFVVSQVGFSPYVNGGISNVVVGTEITDVITTNLPVFGIQPASSTNYSGNNVSFVAVASGVDITYQWYSQNLGMLHDDGVDIIGSTTNILEINNLSSSDNYYVVVTDAYGNTATSQVATNTVITTPTAPFFPTNVVAINATNNLFNSVGFTNIALGTGPLYYQWYFAPTNLPITFSPLSGQNNPILLLTLNDYTYQGQYYLFVSNTVNGGSVAYGPTNTVTELPPSIATIAQLHNFMLGESNLLASKENSSFYINTNNLQVSGYVTTWNGLGSSYDNYFIQDATGAGVEVYVGGNGNQVTPPVGTYVTVSAPLEVYHLELELTPSSLASITTNSSAPVIPLTPRIENANFNNLATNVLGSNSIAMNCSLITFTNVYIYTNKTGGAVANGMTFKANGATTLYFTIGPFGVPASNTNVMELYQYGYNYPSTFPATSPTGTYSPFYNLAIPTNCYQLTGVYLPYGAPPAEFIPSRPQDYVVNPPPAYSAAITDSNGAATVTWPAKTGSTYSLYSSTNLLGPWTQTAYGLTYFPTNGSFTDTNKSGAKFYRLSTP